MSLAWSTPSVNRFLPQLLAAVSLGLRHYTSNWIISECAVSREESPQSALANAPEPDFWLGITSG